MRALSARGENAYARHVRRRRRSRSIRRSSLVGGPHARCRRDWRSRRSTRAPSSTSYETSDKWITSDANHRRVRHRASPARPPQLPTPTPPRPVLQGPLDSWLSASSVQAEVDKAAKLLALAETPTQIASQVQNHARSLACSPVCSLAYARPPAGIPARPLACPTARMPAHPPACTSAHRDRLAGAGSHP